MADFPLSTGRSTNLPSIPLLGTDLVEISQQRAGVWSTAVITLAELMTFIAANIELSAARINAGTLPIVRGGTGGTTGAEARTNLQVADLTDNNFAGNQAVTGTVTATGGFDIP